MDGSPAAARSPNGKEANVNARFHFVVMDVRDLGKGGVEQRISGSEMTTEPSAQRARSWVGEGGARRNGPSSMPSSFRFRAPAIALLVYAPRARARAVSCNGK